MSLIKEGLLTVLIAFIIAMLLAITVRAYIIALSKTPLTKVEIEKSDKDIVTIWLDAGVVVKSDRDNDYWKDQVVINPKSLTVGGQIIMYNLKSTEVDRNTFFVIKVEKEK